MQKLGTAVVWKTVWVGMWLLWRSIKTICSLARIHQYKLYKLLEIEKNKNEKITSGNGYVGYIWKVRLNIDKNCDL